MIIPPTLFHNAWFVVLCVAAASAIVGLLVRCRYLRLAARSRARFEERLAERERIACELHDTLLQSMQGLILGFQALANRLSPNDPQLATLERSLANADEVMAQGRDRVMDLRVPVDSLANLQEALATAASGLSLGSPTECRTLVEGAPRSLQRRVKDEAYRIGREALINAFAHAQARLIEVEIIYGEETLLLRVRDDGVGLDTQALEARSRPGRWGLKGMRERAEEIGGRIEIWSRPGAGTEVELQVPAARAYKRRTRRWRTLVWRLLQWTRALFKLR